MTNWSAARALRVLIATALALTASVVMAQSASAAPFVPGDVFAAIGNGNVNVFNPSTGALKQTLDDTTGSALTTGMCFDASGNLYVTNFSAGSLSKFNNNGALVNANYITGLLSPESCVFDSAGHLYVGTVGDGIQKYSSTGTLLASFPGTGRADWIDLASDQCTMLYTQEGNEVKRYDVCTDTPLSDFTTGLPGPCYALGIRAHGEALVACQPAQWLDSTGNDIVEYRNANGVFALSLDPDGTSFWVGRDGSTPGDDILRLDIRTGTQLKSFDSNAETSLGGLAVFGKITPAVEGPPGSPTCSDRIDNDRDGLIDAHDPGCRHGAKAQCSDGIDNDRDGKTDFSANRHHGDPQCSSPDDNSENQ